MAKLVFSYSHKDEALREELGAHLASLRREGLIEPWHDRRITAGQPLDTSIDTAFARADIIVLLVSPDFINSDYCFEIEVRHAMQRHERGEAIVIPVILRPCEWKRTPFGHLLAAPRDGKPVTTWSNRDEAFHDVTRAVRTAVEKRQTVADSKPAAPARTVTRAAGPRSSHLTLPRRFSEKDKDDFLHEGFQETARFFEASLAEVEQGNRGIEGRYRRLDANRFTAAAYRDGRAVSRCTIWAGGRTPFMDGIGYVENDSGETNSFNEKLSVEVGDDTLFFKPLGMAFMGQGQGPDKLTVSAAAEFLWTLFLRRLQDGR